MVDDNGAEQIRQVLEKGKLSEALDKYISMNSTGEDKPDKIVYESLPTSDSDGLGKACQMPIVVATKSLERNSCNSSMIVGSSSTLQRPPPPPPPTGYQPKKPPRLIHYASQSAINHTQMDPQRFPIVGKFFKTNCKSNARPHNGLLLSDSVDNIEYFNLSETASSSDSPSENSVGGGGMQATGYNYGGSLKDFGWRYETERVVW